MNFSDWENLEHRAHLRFATRPQTPGEIEAFHRWLAGALDQTIEQIPSIARMMLDGWAGFKPPRGCAAPAVIVESSPLCGGPDRQAQPARTTPAAPRPLAASND